MNIDFLKKLFKKSPCFKELSERDLTILAKSGTLKRLNPEIVIYRKGEPSEGRFCMIVTGRVGIMTESGQTFKDIGSGEVLGEIAITSPQDVRTATVKTLEPANILEWDIHHLKAHMPALMRKLKEQAWKNLADYYGANVKQQKAQPQEVTVTKLALSVNFQGMPTPKPVMVKNRQGTFQQLEFVGDKNLKVVAIVDTKTWDQFRQTAQGLTSWIGAVSGEITRIQGTILVLDPAGLQCVEVKPTGR
jgi:signal-transduction protein with cAMP-binding, CBS, and nucleotidyltransferase domain